MFSVRCMPEACSTSGSWPTVDRVCMTRSIICRGVSKSSLGVYPALSLQTTRHFDDEERSIPEPQNRNGVFRPPLIQRSLKKSRPCRLCNGEHLISCQKCEGSGLLNPGGYHPKNVINLNKIVGTKWTARHPTMGRTHFHVAGKRTCAKETHILMTGSCDDTVQIWINANNLKDRDRWSAGWLEKTQRANVTVSNSPCKTCRGKGQLQCPLCANAGRVIEL